ncbi:hypothetical protein P4530_15725 [Bacillus thuringiensis]|nr:hypothetical protein [Bacillus thuringiensis]
MKSKTKILTGIMFSVPLLISSGSIASANGMNSNITNVETSQLQKSANYQVAQKQTVNIEQVARKVIPNYARYIHGIANSSVRVDVRNVKLINVEEKYTDPDYPIIAKLVQRGPEKLIETLTHEAYNNHSTSSLDISHTFTHTVSNASTLTKTVTHSHKAGTTLSYKAKVGVIGVESEVGGELSYEYTNSNQDGTSQSQTQTKTLSYSAKAILPPMTSGTVVSQVYTSPVTYELQSRTYFTGDVEFTYILGSDPSGTVRTKKVSLYELFVRADDDVAYNDHMWAKSYWHPQTGQRENALVFEGKALVKFDEQYRVKTFLNEINKLQ